MMPDYPPGKGLDPAVWTDARAAKIDNLDAAVSSRASGADYTAARAANLDRLANIEANATPVEGTATFNTTDTYPKTVTIIDTSGTNKKHLIDGYIDLSNLPNTEALIIEEKMIIKSGGTAKTYSKVAYGSGGIAVDANQPLIHVTTKPAIYGLQITLTMSSAPAANRSFDYQLFKRQVA